MMRRVYMMSNSLFIHILYVGIQILSLMKVMSGNLKEEVVDLWDEVIPKLITYIEANEADWKQGNWEVCLEAYTCTSDLH